MYESATSRTVLFFLTYYAVFLPRWCAATFRTLESQSVAGIYSVLVDLHMRPLIEEGYGL